MLQKRNFSNQNIPVWHATPKLQTLQRLRRRSSSSRRKITRSRLSCVIMRSLLTIPPPRVFNYKRGWKRKTKATHSPFITADLVPRHIPPTEARSCFSALPRSSLSSNVQTLTKKREFAVATLLHIHRHDWTALYYTTSCRMLREPVFGEANLTDKFTLRSANLPAKSSSNFTFKAW